jgi:hypothetical protein
MCWGVLKKFLINNAENVPNYPSFVVRDSSLMKKVSNKQYKFDQSNSKFTFI